MAGLRHAREIKELRSIFKERFKSDCQVEYFSTDDAQLRMQVDNILALFVAQDPTVGLYIVFCVGNYIFRSFHNTVWRADREDPWTSAGRGTGNLRQVIFSSTQSCLCVVHILTLGRSCSLNVPAGLDRHQKFEHLLATAQARAPT